MVLSPVPGMVVSRAARRDAGELLVLQRCCWVSEAIANSTLSVPALHEDLPTVVEWIDRTQVWVVRVDGRLIGAVRADLVVASWQIGRLMVAPDFAGLGLGRWLLEFVEGRAPSVAEECALFTGVFSARNLRMYEAAGYVRRDPPAGSSRDHIQTAQYLAKGIVNRPRSTRTTREA